MTRFHSMCSGSKTVILKMCFPVVLGADCKYVKIFKCAGQFAKFYLGSERYASGNTSSIIIINLKKPQWFVIWLSCSSTQAMQIYLVCLRQICYHIVAAELGAGKALVVVSRNNCLLYFFRSCLPRVAWEWNLHKLLYWKEQH